MLLSPWGQEPAGESQPPLPSGLGCMVRQAVNISLGILVAWLSVPVVINLLSSRQVMNTSFNPLRIVNTYGAFGRYGPGILAGLRALGSTLLSVLMHEIKPPPLHLGELTGRPHLPQHHQGAD